MNTLTRPVGKFEFGKETPLSHARLIADSVQGAILMDNKTLTNNSAAGAFVREGDNRVLADIPFTFYPA